MLSDAADTSVVAWVATSRNTLISRVVKHRGILVALRFYSSASHFRVPNTQAKASKRPNQVQPRKKLRIVRPALASAQAIPAGRAYTARSSAPKFTTSKGGSQVVISHKELVGTITNGSNTGWYMTPLSSSTPGYDLSPGSAMVFPWLHMMARNFEKYHFNNLSFEFISSAPSSAGGRFYAAIDYDWNDLVPTTKMSMMSNRSTVEGNLWTSLRLNADTKIMHDDMAFKYVESGVRAESEPRTTYGGFLMCAFDTTVTNTVFDLWVHYSVTLIVPQLPVLDLIDTYAGAPLVTVGAVSVGMGGSFGAAVDLPVVTGNRLPVIVPGTGGHPTLAAPIGAATVPLATAIPVGSLDSADMSFICDIVETGVTPAVLIPKTSNTGLRPMAFDKSGAFLGRLDDGISTLSNAVNTVGPKLIAELSTATRAVEFTARVVLQAAKVLHPTMAYIGLVLETVAAIGAGTVLAGFKAVA